MEDWTLPPELQQLERDLCCRSLPDASGDMRYNVIKEVRGLMQNEARRSRWQFGIGVAAAALLWLNLSISATQATNFGLQWRENDPSIEVAAEVIQRLVPELSAQEARREAFLMRVTFRMIPYPSLPADYRIHRSTI